MGSSECDWERELSLSLDYAVKVQFTRARSSPIQLRHATPAELLSQPTLKGGWVVRLHRVFEQAPPEIRADLASWIRVGRRAPRACRDLGAWTELALRELSPRPTRKLTLQPRGQTHDLAMLAAGLWDTEFHGEFDTEQAPRPALTWGRRAKSRTRRSIQLGSYNGAQNLVRIHPVLDQPAVPRWFVRYVLFHEILHAALPSERTRSGRKIVHHGPRFRHREKNYVDTARAIAWEAQHLSKLLRSARANKPMKVRGGGELL